MPTNNSYVDSKPPYGEFERTQRWRDKLYRRLCHKSLDIPENDMSIAIRHGWGWKEMLVVGALAIGGYHLATRETPPPPIAPVEDRDTTRRIGIEKFIPPGNSP